METPPLMPTKSPTTPRSKRVHFSIQNTMVPDLIRAPYPIMEQDEMSQLHYDIPVSYTNDYEQVSSSNHYVDMESKMGSEDNHESPLGHMKKTKKPPALPPKPANLIRLQTISVRPRVVIRNKVSPTLDGSEPDYCSISDVKETKTVQIVAEIHKSADEEEYSTVQYNETINDAESDELEESFEDIPKLPNVAEIVPPKKKDINKYIGLDNYITKSPQNYQSSLNNSSSSMSNRQKIAQILAEITKVSPNSVKSSPATPTYDSPVNIPVVSPMSEILERGSNEPHKSAFDWYQAADKNAHVIEKPDNFQERSNNIENNEKVERPSDPITQDPVFYNDEEVEEQSQNNTTTNQANLFRNLVALTETPVNLGKLKKDKNYQFFLEDSGLSSKPIIPRKKRLYYSGPFV